MNKVISLGVSALVAGLVGCADKGTKLIDPSNSSSSMEASSSSRALNKAEKLVQRMGPGMNLGNALEADPDEGAWGVTLEESYFKMIADSGFKNIRIPVRWETHLKADGSCQADPVWMERVKWAVSQTIQNGMIAVVDQHHRSDLYDDPAGFEECFLNTWKDMATHLKGFSTDSLVLEILNEPQRELDNAKLWYPMQQRAIDVIRAIDPERTLMVGSVAWNSWRTVSGIELRAQDTNLIATFHYYEPHEFTHQGADWNDPVPPIGTTWTATPAQMRDVRLAFDAVKAWSDSKQIPIYLGEFGAYSAADDSSRALWTEFVATQATARGFAWAYWEFCSGFGVYNAQTQEWNTSLMKALMHPSIQFPVLERSDVNGIAGFMLDDFDNYQGDNIHVNLLSGSLAKILDSAQGRWYSFNSDESQILSVDGSRILTWNDIQYDSLQDAKNTNHKMIVPNGYQDRSLYAKMILKGDSYPWVGLGTSFHGTQNFDLAKMQALSFWAKGYGTFKVGFNTDFQDTCCADNWGKFSVEITLDSTWKQYVIWADDLAPSPYSALANEGYEWMDHRNDVHDLVFLSGQNYGMSAHDSLEIWLDNVKFHGMSATDFSAELK